MLCPCRTAAFEIFVRGVTKSHALAAGSAFAFPTSRLSLPPSRPLNRARRASTKPSSGTFASTPHRYASGISGNETLDTAPISDADRPPKEPGKPPRQAKKRRKEARKPPSVEEIAEDERPRREAWQIQKEALKAKFPEGWQPRKRLSPDALAGIRALHQQFPEEYTTEVLAQKFEVSPEAIRRILKSKWEPSPEEEIERQERWFKRGKKVWARWAELGKKPPRKWREEGIVRHPSWNEKEEGSQDSRRQTKSSPPKLSETLL
ncbi:hypothetical protein VTK73DRAFT_85 [Phialemonium thermophilum]|uniref:Required for respiratory growth protein 9, mitochondrial n=1 Tax=Phialemonium thermophilum TaxID=223376 RepID=A0ABR3Y7V0_9PEZI